MSLYRREFFAILGICATSVEEVFAQHDHRMQKAGLNFEAYRPKALTEAEYGMLDKLVETLLPADDTGPGAHDAHVAYYIDVVLNHGRSTTLQFWKNGLAGIERLAEESFQKGFTGCSDSQRLQLMKEIARSEVTPQTELDQFFVELKRTAIEAFYASELIQREHLGYKGNTAVPQFVGCTHLNFEHPIIG